MGLVFSSCKMSSVIPTLPACRAGGQQCFRGQQGCRAELHSLALPEPLARKEWPGIPWSPVAALISAHPVSLKCGNKTDLFLYSTSSRSFWFLSPTRALSLQTRLPVPQPGPQKKDAKSFSLSSKPYLSPPLGSHSTSLFFTP